MDQFTKNVRYGVKSALLYVSTLTGRTDRDAHIGYDNCTCDFESGGLDHTPIDSQYKRYIKNDEELLALEAVALAWDHLSVATNRGDETEQLSHPLFSDLAEASRQAYEAMCKTDGEASELRFSRVTAEHRELYRVRNVHGEYWAKVTGKHMFEAQSREDYPAVGDWVEIGEIDGDHTTILQVLPRKTILKRKYAGKDDAQLIAANIDAAFIVESANRDFNLNRLERYFVLAKDGGIQPIAVLNKADLVSADELQTMVKQIEERFGKTSVIAMSARDGSGMQALKDQIECGKTYCLLGSSGVGKSTIINRLLEEEAIETQEISLSTGRGKHTTTAREMHFLKSGGIVIDNPGTREVGVADSEEGVRSTFDDIEQLVQQCRFSDCTHTHEKGCAVKQALEQGKLDRKRLDNYLKLLDETRRFEMTKRERHEVSRQFGKMVKGVKKDLKNRKGY